ncbi:MAG: replication-associated recombination protein A [Planctomycetota bacterium]|jgi:putative ATPase
MHDLWHQQREARRDAARPLAARLRPRRLEEVAGQRHLVAPGAILERMIRADRVGNLILVGPPGTGKTTLAEVIAGETGRHVERAHAAMMGVREVRDVLERATRRIEDSGRGTVLLLDEIHRFSRSQQDVLLADVERGTIVLVGATTENPWFMVNAALVSRSTVLQLEPLSEADIIAVLRRAMTDPEGFPGVRVEADEDALALWARRCDGDARRALTALELAVLSSPPEETVRITRDLAAESIQTKALRHDASGDQHYDLASAFIKSMRSGDGEAALLWLARMLEGGEDPRFIARRIAIFASEDVGNADPQALATAAAAWQVLERVGLPEGRIVLAQATLAMAAAPKSRASIEAIDAAIARVRDQRTAEVPMSIRDSRGTARRVQERQEQPERDR